MHSRIAQAVIVGLALLSSSAGFAAAGTSDEPPPLYEPWTGDTPYRSAANSAPVEPAPPPIVALPEYARRPFELVPAFAVALAHCSEALRVSERCASLGTGLGAGLSGLYRVTPYFAFGLTFAVYQFRIEPRPDSGLSGAGSSSLFAGVLGRVYFVPEGTVDPYLELGLGGGSFRTSARELPHSTAYEETASAPAARIGAGIDFSLGRAVRLGPALDWTAYGISRVRRCAGTVSCSELSAELDSHPNGFVSLGARLGIAFGKPL